VSVKRPALNANRLNNKLIKFEKKFYSQKFSLFIGIDEAGRGPLAGPVVASAVAIKSFPLDCIICDSKKISAKVREESFHEIIKKSYYGIGIINESMIDQINILQATFLAMSLAVKDLVRKLPEQLTKRRNFEKQICLLIDGGQFKSDLPYSYRTIKQGDARLFSIACASIVAKVTRDRILTAYDQLYPQYGFSRHKGYPTKEHKKALRKYGPTLFHRKTFKY